MASQRILFKSCVFLTSLLVVLSRVKVDGRKLYVTMVIKRIKPSDSGQYRCTLPNDTNTSYGFGITYIAKSDLPEIEVSRNITAELGESVRLACNITQKGNIFKVRLVIIAWVKDDHQRIAEVPSAERNLKDIRLTLNKPQDGGHYECKLTSMLHAQRTYNVTRIISVQVRPKFGAVDLTHNEIVRIKGEAVQFQCDATGNPIKIVWKRKPRHKNLLITLNETSYSNESLQTRYKFTRKSNYEEFKLEIPKTDYEDRGDYYCCIRSSNTSVPDQCQRFTLRVKDPLRHLWPILGIIVEAIFLYVITTSSEKTKKNDNKISKSRDHTVEDRSTDVRKGEKARLRKTTLDP
ncbi:basigin-like isoform X2 [Actinia tenebrosa]|uniref:Basigin-like isoform X2 n=1 Tax=Actinia tenebrosa TaxID=6105 RepID=A0A6P8J1S6_ACTTE|nr:basigin-like isoform X2 [Actinia tenebrosa]